MNLCTSDPSGLSPSGRSLRSAKSPVVKEEVDHDCPSEFVSRPGLGGVSDKLDRRGDLPVHALLGHRDGSGVLANP